MRICSRPRTSSSVSRTIGAPQFKFSNNTTLKISDNENQNGNRLLYEKTDKNMRVNTQRRQLHPPNFQVSYYVEPSYHNLHDKSSSKYSQDSNLDASLCISKTKKSSINRRSQSATRLKRESSAYLDKSKDDKPLSNKNIKENKNSLYQSYSIKKSQDEISHVEPQRVSSHYNEYKNSDGSIKKLSEKFHYLEKHQSYDNIDDYSNSYRSSIFNTKVQESIYPESCKSNFVSNPISSIEISQKNSKSNDNSRGYSNINKSRSIVKDVNSFQASLSATEQFRNQERDNEKIVDSIELAMSRIKKEINEKEMNPNGAKPKIAKRKRNLLKENEQTSKSIDFEFLQDEPFIKEQNNKSTIEKPHVSFMNTFQPPKKKNNDNHIINNFTDQDIPKQATETSNQSFEKMASFVPSCIDNKRSSQKKHQNQDLDEFMEIEKQMKEEIDDNEDKGQIIPNFLKIIKILRDQLDKSQYQEVIRIMNQNKSKHFLLLLTRPLMNIDAVYIMRGDLKSASLLWGYGPKKVTKEMIDLFWKYNVTTKLFDDQQLNNFEPNLDAVSIIKKQ